MSQADFEIAILHDYIKKKTGLTLHVIERLGGGQSNPTFHLDCGSDHLVLRKQPSGPLLKGAHALDREFRVLSALQTTDIPVPRPILFESDSTLLGTSFYLMDYINGRVVHDASLPTLLPHDRMALYEQMAVTLARLHNLSPITIGLEDFGKAGNYFERQFHRWTHQYQNSQVYRIKEIDQLIDRLAPRLPADDGISALVHGDYRMGNVMIHPTEPRINALLDWELSTIGHPLADLGFIAMTWLCRPEDYGGLAGLDLAARHIPALETFINFYQSASNRKIELLPVHIAFALFRFAIIFVGIAGRAAQGNAAGENAKAVAPLAQRFATLALDLLHEV